MSCKFTFYSTQALVLLLSTMLCKFNVDELVNEIMNPAVNLSRCFGTQNLQIRHTTNAECSLFCNEFVGRDFLPLSSDQDSEGDQERDAEGGNKRFLGGTDQIRVCHSIGRGHRSIVG
mmetsp:Transcript_27686/g.51955  ORF Transcript_27686/g.51955 Transcript_27686/m.51955 type:complete len:118 (-) Transcript_27686:2318-2671(-)